ncbi:amino acid transporter [Actinomadura sp. ATCC 31491]|uniref:Amino acid transporter n=1 Tax=Actinomadura luzonensis TaxID=2805427 RepID=A0ABT0G434_9ACTN|nr:amino acid transporter [Actinomadura luzonensis]MCK2219357.1 amino acid transporter [Actinomadura luzonensis]
MTRIETPWGPWEAAPLGEHGDVDVGLLRRDQLAARRLLDGWDVHAAVVPGVLRPWPAGETLPATAHDVWVRERPGGPWRFQLMLDEADGGDWVYRRDPRVRRPLAGLTAGEDGFRRLAPEVQLLYKAMGTRPKDAADVETVLPLLTGEQRRWLAGALATAHPSCPWRARLGR